METQILEIAERIKGLREILGFTVEEMASAAGVEPSEYQAYEDGQKDFSFTFLYKCAEKFGVDMVELLTGSNPHLSFYSVVRANEGLRIRRRKNFEYQHLAYRFKGKLSEPFLVTAPYQEEAQEKEIELSHHKGQELDFILSGKLKIQLENHIEILEPGDAIYYDSGRGHGMIAVDGEDCKFLAIILKNGEETDNG